MKIVFAQHDGCATEFCWEVPESIEYDICKGDVLLVETYQGTTIATATTGVISGNGVEDVAMKAGAYYPLKRVISYADKNMRQYITNKFANEIIESIKKQQNSTVMLKLSC